MPKFEMQIETPHPILMLADSSPDTELPEEIVSFVAATGDCVCFSVLSHVDGATRVVVSDGACELGGKHAFNGSIDARSGVLTMFDSHNFSYLNIPVHAGPVAVDIWADDETNPDWVWIKLGAIRNA